MVKWAELGTALPATETEALLFLLPRALAILLFLKKDGIKGMLQVSARRL